MENCREQVEGKMESHIILCGQEIGCFPSDRSLSQLLNFLAERYKLNSTEIYATQHGKLLSDQQTLFPGDNVHINLRCRGGKGGFGSMLRAIGAQIEKTTNREACRDLSGRRLRDINEEKRLKAWLDKQKDRDAEAEERRRKKLEKLMTVPKHDFKDVEYETARSDLTEKVSAAVEEGFKKAATKATQPTGSGTKRKSPIESNGAKKKTAGLWIDDDLLSSSSDTTDDSDEEIDKKKAKTGSAEKTEKDNEKDNSSEISSDSVSSSGNEERKSVEVEAKGENTDPKPMKRNHPETLEDEPESKNLRVNDEETGEKKLSTESC